ncbi:MAG: agmatine deiminase family protein [Atopobiaceae bacterium]|jgi:agmatine deiminase
MSIIAVCLAATAIVQCVKPEEEDTVQAYTIPHESAVHEGTWLVWPHAHTYGEDYAKSLEPIWIQMTQYLSTGEKVHIVAYDQSAQNYIEKVLHDAGVRMDQIEITIAKSDDVWARDTAGMFAYDPQGNPTILDFGFDGWGKKTAYANDDKLPQCLAAQTGYTCTNMDEIVLEGGSVELDGMGTMMATRSSVISKNRNPEVSQEEMEQILSKYLGVTHFIWLDGVVDEDITDAHIDGMARFFDDKTLVTVPEDDFFELYEGIKEEDYDALVTATNANGQAYKIVEIPLTKENVKGLDYKGSYLNYYVANTVVLVPMYLDANDELALNIIQGLYPDKEVVGIDVTPLYKHGGMLHCVTQQQPKMD